MNFPESVLRAGLRGARTLFGTDRVSMGTKRRLVDLIAASSRPDKRSTFTPARLADVPVEFGKHGGRGDAMLVYLHGGGYSLGSARGYRGLVSRLGIAGGFDTVTVDYTLSPDVRFPVALEQAHAVIRALYDQGIEPHQLVIAGDSAGGGLTMALALALRDAGDPMPAALGLISPWMDLVADAQGTRADGTDPLIAASMITQWVEHYTGGLDPDLPLISPVYADVSGLPPMVIHSSGRDPIAADAKLLEQRLLEAGHSTDAIEHRRFESLWHVFHLQAGFLAAADEALEHMGQGLRRRVGVPTP